MEEIIKEDKAQKDILEFIECAKTNIKPYNELVYKIILEVLEMMLIRLEKDNQVGGILSVKRELDLDYSKLSTEEMNEINEIVKEVQE